MAYPYTTIPPPGYGHPGHDYPTSASTSPGPEDPAYDYYIPYTRSPMADAGFSPSPLRHAHTTPIKHSRTRTASFATPRAATWATSSPAGGPAAYATVSPTGQYKVTPGYYEYVSTQHNASAPDGGRVRTTTTTKRRVSVSGASPTAGTKQRESTGPGNGKGNGSGYNGYARPDVHLRQASAQQARAQRIFVDARDAAGGLGSRHAFDSSDEEPVYTYIEPRFGESIRPSPANAAYHQHYQTTTTPSRKPSRKADSFRVYPQTATGLPHYQPVSSPEPVFVDTPVRSRARRSSTSATATPTTPRSAHHTRKASAAQAADIRNPPKSARPSVRPAPAVATAADAVEHNIPAGYSLKNWDPTETPILLLGSVFDANSMGKWIYDWTVYHHGAGSPLTQMAGDLWLLLIKFAGKMRRAEEGLKSGRIRGRDNRETVREYLGGADRNWARMKTLLKVCEEYMWKAARDAAAASAAAADNKKSGGKGGTKKGSAAAVSASTGESGGKVQMGEKSGIEFVKAIFGRERELQRTEQLMAKIKHWNDRFDADCEGMLRRRVE